MHMFRHQHMKGFSLVEFIVIIIVVSVLAVVINTSWPGLVLNMDAQSEQLATDLRYTQTLSMTQGQRYCLKISGSTYQIVNSASNTPIVLAFGNTTVTLGKGLSFGTISPSNASMFVFDGKGAPYYSASASCTTANATAATALASAATIAITTGSATKTISINPDTGGVTVQ